MSTSDKGFLENDTVQGCLGCGCWIVILIVGGIVGLVYWCEKELEKDRLEKAETQIETLETESAKDAKDVQLLTSVLDEADSSPLGEGAPLVIGADVGLCEDEAERLTILSVDHPELLRVHRAWKNLQAKEMPAPREIALERRLRLALQEVFSADTDSARRTRILSHLVQLVDKNSSEAK